MGGRGVGGEERERGGGGAVGGVVGLLRLGFVVAERGQLGGDQDAEGLAGFVGVGAGLGREGCCERAGQVRGVEVPGLPLGRGYAAVVALALAADVEVPGQPGRGVLQEDRFRARGFMPRQARAAS